MTVRSRPLPLSALVLAVATAIAASVALSGPAGAVVSADPDNGTCETNGRVNAVAYLGGTIYLGGSFTTVGASARGHLAALRASGGGLESWDPGADGVFGAFGAAITSSRVAFGGEFTQAGGEAHQGLVQFSGTP
jgi:hypothetical protein